MSNSVQFNHVIPAGFSNPALTTTANAINSKMRQVYKSTENTKFSSSANRHMRFQVSSHKAFADMASAYILMDVTIDNSEAKKKNVTYRLSDAGVHSFFRSISVRAISDGLLYDRAQDYHRQSAIIDFLGMSPEHVTMRQWHQYGGRLGGEFSVGCTYARAFAQTGTAVYLRGVDETTGNYVTAANAVNPATRGVMRERVQAHDVVISDVFTSADDSLVDGFFTSNVDIGVATDVVGFVNPTHSTDSVAYTDYWRTNGEANHRVPNAGQHTLFRSGYQYTLLIKPNMSIFSHVLPLFLINQGIHIEFELENPARVFQKDSVLFRDDVNTIDYVIENPEFYVDLIEPHQDIIQQMIAKWNTPQGVAFPIHGYEVKRAAPNREDVKWVIEFNVGKRSVQNCIAVIMDSKYCDGIESEKFARQNDCITTWLRGTLKEYHFRIGATDYPRRRIEEGKALGTREFWEQLRQVSSYRPTRIRQNDFEEVNTTVTSYTGNDPNYVKAHATKFMLAVDFSRAMNGDPDRGLAGVDTTGIQVQIEVERLVSHQGQGWLGNPIVFGFFMHDKYLVLRSAGDLVLE